MRLLNLLIVTATMLACTVGVVGAQTPQQLEELQRVTCEFYKKGELVRSERPAGIAGPDGLAFIQKTGETIKASAPYTVLCDRYPLRKRGERCFEGSNCYQEAPRRVKDCNGEVLVIRPPPGSSIQFPKTGCWHIVSGKKH